jgi:hypothetical protein
MEDKFKVALIFGENEYYISEELVFTNQAPDNMTFVSGLSIVIGNNINQTLFNYYNFDGRILPEYYHKTSEILTPEFIYKPTEEMTNAEID